MSYTTVELSNTIHGISIYKNMQVYVKYNEKYYSITDYSFSTSVNNYRSCIVIKAHGVSSSFSADTLIESLNDCYFENLSVLFSVDLYKQVICDVFHISLENECIIIHVVEME